LWDMRKEWMEKDYYAELGVTKDADQKEIKKAFRKLARQLHPDNNPGDAEAEGRFKEINEAYDTIGDEDSRKEYDHVREMGYFVGGPAGNQQYVRVEDLVEASVAEDRPRISSVASRISSGEDAARQDRKKARMFPVRSH